jgi:hypothetical protein
MVECNTNGVKRNAYVILVEKHERKRPLGRPTHRLRVILQFLSDGMGWYELVLSGSG